MKKNYIVFLLLGFFLLCGCVQRLELNRSSKDYIGKDYEVVVKELTDLGFYNFETKALDDLGENSPTKEGAVALITMNGEPFKKDSSFFPDAEVYLEYHSIIKKELPVSQKEASDMSLEELKNSFYDAGFRNIICREKEDETIEEEHDSYHVINIDGQEHFAKGDALPYNTEIMIETHIPKQTASVSLYIECKENWFFNKYDIRMNLQDESYTLMHGSDFAIEMDLLKGEHVIEFIPQNMLDAAKNYTFVVKDDMQVSLKLTCQSDCVEIYEQHIYRGDVCL